MKLTNQQIEAVAELLSCKEERAINKKKLAEAKIEHAKLLPKAKKLLAQWKSIPQELRSLMYSHKTLDEKIIVASISVPKEKQEHCCQQSYKQRVVLASIDAVDFNDLKKRLEL